MRILLVGNYEPDAQRSMLEYEKALASGLSQRGLEVRRISARPRLLKGNPHGGLGKWLGYLDKFVLFRKELRRAASDVDLVHVCDQGNGMLVPSLQGFRHLLTCHDVIAIRVARKEIEGPETSPTGRVFQRLNLHGLGVAQDVVCVSETTRTELEAVAKRPDGRTHVVYNGLLERYPDLDDSRIDALLRAQGLAPDVRFLLHIGNNSSYKNRPGAVRIFSLLRQFAAAVGLHLVLAGKPPNSELREAIAKSAVSEDIHILEDIDHETKVALYRRAKALLFPSLIEGFGLPIIEAQTLGCPVITSDRGPMNEIAGDSAVLIDPLDEADSARRIAEALLKFDQLRQKGFENARRFTEGKMIEGYVKLYEQLLSGDKGR